MIKNQQKHFTLEEVQSLDYKGLYDCYTTPSETKRDIFSSWYDTLSQLYEIVSYGVKSYNCNFITLHTLVKTSNNDYKYIVITPNTRRYYEVIA